MDIKEVFISRDFNNEKEFQKYLIDNVELWCKDFFGSEVKDVKEQWYLNKFNKKFGSNKPRIDICLNTRDGKRIGIEVKNPKQCFCELSRSISQLLAYGILAENNGVPFSDLVIIVSRFDDILLQIIKRFNLPIRVFIVNRRYHAELV